MHYQTTINIDIEVRRGNYHETVEYRVFHDTENESVEYALASYAAAGYTADQINSIETMAYECTWQCSYYVL